MRDAIILFGGTLLFIALPLHIMCYISYRREKQNEKEA